MTIFVGDIHADSRMFTCEYLPAGCVQVGDLNLMGYSDWVSDGIDRYFIEGNHDHFPTLRLSAKEPYSVARGLLHIPRGYVKGGVLYIGGGESIDKYRRTPGLDWFYEEGLTNSQVSNILDIDKPVRSIVSHVAPRMVSAYKDFTARALDEVFKVFRPSMWVFGHMHESIDVEIEGCRFIGLGIGEIRDVDV